MAPPEKDPPRGLTPLDVLKCARVAQHIQDYAKLALSAAEADSDQFSAGRAAAFAEMIRVCETVRAVFRQ